MRILVIEDESRIRAFLTRGLEAEGYTVVASDSGTEGLALATSAAWDLVVLDLLLPGLSGLQVLRELHRERPRLPVVILSARSDLQTKLRGFELGATDYVPKPFSLDELLARIRVQLRNAGGLDTLTDDEHVLEAGRIVLDLARRQARIGELVTDLTDREFRLLHHLLVHAGEVISRERLLAEVWGYGFDPGSNVVDVCVRRLRLKLGPDAPIETVRHAGYRLAAA
ncbi:MAG TPA: response regulator transcription factor [Gaiellaceae bacterium]|nr:response regulator transcription factor [Gaiellaceae bacterium]